MNILNIAPKACCIHNTLLVHHKIMEDRRMKNAGGGMITNWSIRIYSSNKDGRKELVISLREEIKKGVNKERYLSKEDASLLNQFIQKIQKELQESEN